MDFEPHSLCDTKNLTTTKIYARLAAMNSPLDPQTGPQFSAQPQALHQRAQDNLHFIRTSMERATSFTGVSGKSYCVAGVTVLIATAVAQQQSGPAAWLTVWMIELALAASIILWMTMRKAQAQGGSLWSSNGRKLLAAFTPAMVVGGVLTVSCALQEAYDWLPGIWLSLYGAAIMTAGAYSVAIIPVMGAVLLLCGSVVLLLNIDAALLFGLIMGSVHILFGLLIWRSHGG